MVPDPDPIKEGEEDETTEDNELIQKVRDFVFMNNEEISKKLDGAPENAETRALRTEEDMRADRAIDSGMPYGPQSVRELGCAGIDYSWVPGPFITPALADEVQDKASGRARSYDYYEGQWDGGKLMTAFRKWVYTESTQKILFVYGSNDPWTGGAIDFAAAETNPHIVLVLDPGGIHATDFLNQNSFTKESSQLIQTWVKAFLGL
jgi:pimeloyl-ACP methyl ester carboxylesterase